MTLFFVSVSRKTPAVFLITGRGRQTSWRSTYLLIDYFMWAAWWVPAVISSVWASSFPSLDIPCSFKLLLITVRYRARPRKVLVASSANTGDSGECSAASALTSVGFNVQVFRISNFDIKPMMCPLLRGTFHWLWLQLRAQSSLANTWHP